MHRTKRFPLRTVFWIGIIALVAMSGCGSSSDTASSPDGNRYFGDHPGQEASKAAIGADDCQVLRRSVEGVEDVRVGAESEPSPPSSRCLISGRGLHVSVYLDASTAARQRYFNRMVEQVQFYGTEPAKRPHAVAGVGDRGAYEHSASWIPAFSTLYAVRGNRWLTVSYAATGVPKDVRKERAAALARRGFRLTAR
ncbi:MAG TPA: hypothetical protein VNC16_09825 [Solirubrobacterales bacterium]|jgi:hypothetical protein|nr:hypothetical protein [Solirubrobacterales bacterium]